jgi:phage protein D
MSEHSNLISHFYVKINGADASEELMRALIEVKIENSLHMPDMATITVHDPQLRWLDGDLFQPGKPVEISAKATAKESRSQVVFDGEIVEIEPDFGPSTHHLVIRAFDRLHRLARGSHVRSFQNVTDSDVVQRLAREAGLQPDFEDTSLVHQYLFQSNQTNLDFLRQRAAAVGYLLYVEGKRLCFKPLAVNGKPVELRWGETLSEFRPRLTTIAQVNSVTVRSWDPATRREIVGEATRGQGAPEIKQDKKGGDAARSAFNIDATQLISNHPVRTQAAADRLAQAVANRQIERFVEAEGTCGGAPEIVAGKTINIGAVGDHFSGTYFVTATSHIYNAKEGYHTHFSVSGQTPATLLSLLRDDDGGESRDTGLMIGIVTDNQDPEGQGRVKVKYPSLSSDHASDWARVVAVGAGAQRGIQFLPEVDDEVLVGFEMGDVHHPYILGGLWNGQDGPPKPSGEVLGGGRVERRIIRSRSGHTIILDDSDSSGSISIEDRKGNKIVLDSLMNNLTIEVKGDAALTAEGNLSLKARGQIEINGMGVKIDGGGATVDVKGTVINLN